MNEIERIIVSLQETRKLSERGASVEKEEAVSGPVTQSDDIHDIIKEKGVTSHLHY